MWMIQDNIPITFADIKDVKLTCAMFTQSTVIVLQPMR